MALVEDPATAAYVARHQRAVASTHDRSVQRQVARVLEATRDVPAVCLGREGITSHRAPRVAPAALGRGVAETVEDLLEHPLSTLRIKDRWPWPGLERRLAQQQLRDQRCMDSRFA
jgi:hypothetical protein